MSSPHAQVVGQRQDDFLQVQRHAPGILHVPENASEWSTGRTSKKELPPEGIGLWYPFQRDYEGGPNWLGIEMKSNQKPQLVSFHFFSRTQTSSMASTRRLSPKPLKSTMLLGQLRHQPDFELTWPKLHSCMPFECFGWWSDVKWFKKMVHSFLWGSVDFHVRNWKGFRC